MAATTHHVLRLGLDGKPLLPPRTGVYRYTAGLLRGLETIAGGNLELTLHTPRRPLPTTLWVLCSLQRATTKGLDVLHCPFYYPPLFPGCPVTATVHDALVLEHPEWFPRAWGALMRRLIRRGARTAAALVTPSLHVARTVEECCGVPLQRIRVIPHGVDTAVWSPPSPDAVGAVRHRFGLRGRWLVQLGAVEPRRGVDLLLQAAAPLRRLHTDLEVVLAGGVRAPIAELSRPPGWVRVIPWVEDEELPALLAGAAAVAAPSRGEGFDLPVLEALACGAVVVASDIPVHVEHFAGAVELFRSGDADALAAAIAGVLDDTARQQRLRGAARALAARFTWEESARLHLALWREVAGA